MFHFLWIIILVVPCLALTIILLAIPCFVLSIFGQRKLVDDLVFAAASMLANLILFLAGVKVNLSGEVEEVRRRVKEGEGFCYVSNHTSVLDIVVILAKLKGRCGFVAKKELLYVPLLNIAIAMVHSVFIDRKNLKKGVLTIQKATQNIRNGNSMMIYPEGTRSKTGEIAPFKHGSFRMATESGACIVPVTIKGLRPAFEQRKHFFQKSECFVNVGELVVPADPKDREAVGLMIQKVESGIRESYSRLG